MVMYGGSRMTTSNSSRARTARRAGPVSLSTPQEAAATRAAVIADGKLMGEGAPDKLLASEDPYLKQFLHQLPDGPVRFHFPARPFAEELKLGSAAP